jgi:nucleoside-diphosphate-sugar epimerase
MSKPKVLVTGASGLIGGLVLGNLSDRYEFSGLSRHEVPGIPYTVGSITDRDAVRRAVAGQDMVLHLAGETQSLEWDEQFEVTAGGTLNVLRAAAAAGVRRFVLMSTGSTMCGWEWDESLPYGRLAAGERDLPAVGPARLPDPAAPGQPVRRGEALL